MSADEDLSRLLSSAVLVFVGMLFGSFSKLLERVVIANWVTVDAYGEVSVALAIVNISVALTLLGFNQGIPRYVSRFDDERDLRGVWLSGLLAGGVMATIAALLLYFNLGFVTDRLFESAGSKRLLAVFAVCIPLIVGLRVGVGAIRGFENTVYRTYARDLLYNGLRLAVMVALLAAGWGVIAAGYAYLAAAAVSFVAVHVLLNRLLPLSGDFQLHTRKLVVFSTPLVVSTIISILLMETDTLMLGYFRSPESVALYGAAFPLARGIPVVMGAFGYLYFPLASRLDTEDEHEEIDAVYKLTTKWGFLAMFPLFLTFFAFPGDVIRIVFGSEYSGAKTALSILATGFFARGAFGRNGDTISALGHPRYVFVANVTAYVVNFGLNLVLIPRFGFVGAAVTSAIASVVLNGVLYGVLRLRFGISPFSRWTIRTYAVLLGGVLPGVLALSRHVSLTLATLPLFAVGVGLVSVAALVVTGCLQPEDRIPIRLVESKLGIETSIIARYVPES
ncbi:flippase [Halosimplex pelagicum]|uniref:Flippase n=1 Tax=Halosimplex pelagicum TaxID=869886 RepID=A0A7D5TA92_9EURY|nr:flippase [Halosimplex pelagicum]QLH81189.1 flippase [Halosimplex pelagicum]